jgi:asparagine synthase
LNVFVVGFDPAGLAVEAMQHSLRALADEAPFLDADAVRSWQSSDGKAASAWLCDEGVAVGGVDYVHADDRALSLFAGRPIAWRADGSADGRSTLNPRMYLAPAVRWAEQLDGRFAAVRYAPDDLGLEVVTDPMGAYPVYTATAGSCRFVSNRPALIAALLPRREHEPVAVAYFLACGWALGGGCLWRGIRRLERGHIHRFGDRGDAKERIPGPDAHSLLSMFGAGLDPPEAASALVESVRASADWPGRPSVLFLSGGLDSRVVFAAALESGVELSARTVASAGQLGYPDTMDVVIARRLAAEYSIPHTVVSSNFLEGVGLHARWMRLLTNGLVSLGDTGALRVPPKGVPLELAYSGQGGEVSRNDYGIGPPTAPDLLEQILRHVVPRWPRSLMNNEGHELVRAFVRDWIDRHLHLGGRSADLTDLFYLLERMPNWAAPSQMYYEQRNDTISPLWFSRLIPHQLALAAGDRRRSLFHLALLSALAPDLARLEFAGVNPPWPVFGARRAARSHRIHVLANKATSEARRRLRARLRRSFELENDPFVQAMAEAQAGVANHVDHPVWRYLDRKRVERLLRTDPLRLDPRNRRAVWRLASIFVDDHPPR